MSRRTSFAIGTPTVLGILAVGSTLVMAQFNPFNNAGYMKSMTDSWSAPITVGQLVNNEGIYVDKKEFKINKGAAKGDPAEQIRKSGAREVTEGAIIFRSDGKLYIVDGTPPN
jgi:hypothetical protein